MFALTRLSISPENIFELCTLGDVISGALLTVDVTALVIVTATIIVTRRTMNLRRLWSPATLQSRYAHQVVARNNVPNVHYSNCFVVVVD